VFERYGTLFDEDNARSLAIFLEETAALRSIRKEVDNLMTQCYRHFKVKGFHS
jgi:hypothetical protein